METKNISYFTLEGSYEEIGRKMALMPNLTSGVLKAPNTFTDNELNEAINLYRKYCPGLVRELEGYAAASNVSVSDIAFTWMTYLIPRCSGLIVEGSLMNDGDTRLARNYEFDLEHEDLVLFKTKPEGKYAHIGGSVVLFGRSEGINECGLAVSMSSCGLPVSNMSGMRPPKIKGLQFWAVIRSILENCKDVDEALALVKEMPIAYNINLFLADENGNGCLVETMDGELSFERISPTSKKKYVCGTNHIVIPSFQKWEPYAMKNSVIRLQTIENFMEDKKSLAENDITSLFQKTYPEGLSSRYYDDFFGTIKTVVMVPKNRTFKIHWLLEEENGWEIYQIADQKEDHVLEKYYMKEKADPSFFEVVRL
ncbi:C45 family autoproteolytic acyltransferase/hydolase [Anoxynatronum buryatiense]|uniref:Predicted choloylglycine hydrolase n=1 Tax=Anoxynatronum buryatiense TaxID=489973 RepID=A0AA45WWF5_9CLOT|nr:C45 family peptidase [Anoxynatronum buryatiense]SMP59845.1 Predicted choloylglycine hydrolase [Anoxynatronum buryatiense]